MKKIFLLSIIVAFITTSCVSTKEFDKQKALTNKYLDEKDDCKDALKSTSTELETANAEINELKANNLSLSESVSLLSKSKINLSKLIEEEKALREKTNQAYEKHMLSSSLKEESLTEALADKERKLTKKEATLLSLQKDLETREKELKNTKLTLQEKETNLNSIQTSLTEKAIKIEDLKSKINAQKEAMNDLKNSVTKALKGFTSEDLTITEKDGRIYVSLSEKLLFKSGSFTLDKKGQEAIEKLAKVLAKQTDVDILVEGHTDADKFSGKGSLLDNWDLSVKRATSVVRILENNKVDKTRIVASGRGPNRPVAENKTKEGKAKNRRTEIILSPDLNKLMQILQAD